MSEWMISSSVLIALVVILRYVLRGKINLRLQYALWLVVLVRLLMPFSLVGSSFSVASLLQMEHTHELSDIYLWYGEETDSNGAGEYLPDSEGDGVQAGEPGDGQNGVQNDQAGGEKPGNQPGNADTPVDPDQGIVTDKHPAVDEEPNYPVISGVSIAPSTEKLENSGKEHISLSGILTVIWCAGMAVTSVILLVSNLRFWKNLRKTRWIYEKKEDALWVYESDVVETPCLFGLIRPAIYVTHEAIREPNVMHHVLAHETTHYAHRDHIWAVLRCLCLVLHWYNPLVWWAADLSRRDAELACDEGTIERIGEAVRAEYGRTLIGLTCQGRGYLLSTATTMTGSVKGIKERIMLIANRPKMARYTVMILIILVMVMIGCTYCGVKEPADGANLTEESTESADEDTTEEATTAEPTAEEPATAEPTTEEPATEEPTTEEPATKEPTTAESTTEEPTTAELTTEEPTTAEPTTEEPTTAEPTTEEPTTAEPTTEEPTTAEPTTEEPTTAEPTTEEPTTAEPTTEEPTTAESTTEAPENTDSQGLAYTVNDDGVTCTITGLGTCTDTYLYIPSHIDGYKVTRIGENAFNNCNLPALIGVKLPDSVVEICKDAFSSCIFLEEIIVPAELTTIGESAFAACFSLTEFVFPDSIVYIGDSAFSGCRSLNNVVWPREITQIGEYMFSSCWSLTEITIPEGVTTIGYGAFNGCNTLTEIQFPDSVTNIGSGAFSGCHALAEIRWPSNLAEIEMDAFAHCYALESVTIPDRVTAIGDYAFDFCENLKEITIPDSVTTIGQNVFQYCDNLTDIHFKGTVQQWNDLSKGDTWHGGIEACVVHCTDGNLLFGNQISVGGDHQGRTVG